MNIDLQTILIGVVSVGILVLLLVIRYIIYYVFGKAEDAVNKKINEHKSKKKPSGTQKLSDRYK